MEPLAWLEDLFAAVWKASWQASVVIGLLVVLLAVFGRRIPPSWRYPLWLIVIARLLLPAAPASTWSIFNWVRLDSASDSTLAFAARSPGSAAATAPETAALNSGAIDAPRTLRSRIDGSTSAPRAKTDSVVLRPPSLQPSRVASLVWFSGAALFACCLGVQYWRLHRRLAGARRVADPVTLHAWTEAATALRLKRLPALVETPHVLSPALFGFARTRLLLPEGFTRTMTADEMRHVFLHEAAHLQRGDLLVNWVLTALHVVHWFNPVVWFGFSRLRADRELACDARALDAARSVEARTYAQTIIKLLEGCTVRQSLPGLVGILEDKNQIKQRIAMLAKFKAVRRWPVLAISLLAVVGIVALTDAQVDTADKPATSAPATSAANAGVAQRIDANTRGRRGTLTLRQLAEPKYSFLEGTIKVSPDGRYIIYGGKCEVALAEAPGKIIQSLAKIDQGFAFSRDGSRIAIMEDNEIRTMALDGANSTSVVRDPSLKSAYLHDWSKDGAWFAVHLKSATNEYSVGLIKASDGSIRRLNARGSTEPNRAAFSPDGRYLAYDMPAQRNHANCDIHVVDLDTGRVMPAVVHQANDRLLGWNPTTGMLLFCSNRRGSYGAWSLRIADGGVQGDPMLVKTDLGGGTMSGANPLGFTNTGAFYFAQVVHLENIYSLAIDAAGKARGPAAKAIERFEGFNSASDWSKDGRYLAYSSARAPYVLSILDTKTQRERVLGEGLYGPKWSPDGKSLLAFSDWNSHDRHLYKVDVATDEQTLLVVFSEERRWVRSYDWAPDGKAFYYQYSSGKISPIVRRDLATGTETEIFRVENGEFFAVSPDGQTVVFRQANRNLYLVPSQGGATTLLAELGPGFIPGWDTFAWSADGTAVLVCKWQTDRTTQVGDTVKVSELLRIPINTGVPELVLTMQRVRYPNPHPDGTRITFSASTPSSELWIMEELPASDRITSN